MIAIHSSDAQASKLGKGELLALIFVVAAFWIINLAMCSRSPPVWMDEVAYSDPGVKLYLGNGFRSTAWATQLAGWFWAGNVPLHPFLLAIWLKRFGLRVGKDVLVVWAGMFAGVCLLLTMYQALGALPDFIGSISNHTPARLGVIEKAGLLYRLLTESSRNDPGTILFLVYRTSA